MNGIYEMKGITEEMTDLEQADKFWSNARERVMLIAEANCFPLSLEEHDDSFLYDLYDNGDYIPTGEEITTAMALAILAGYLLILGIGCLVADFVFPHIPFINRFLDSLPDWEDKD